MERKNMLETFYNAYDEDARLLKNRQGQLEYRTTMQYIRRLLPVGKKLLEVGAGTGRYSIALAKEGYDVTAVELVERNLEILRRNAQGQGQLTAYQGDASNLDFLASNSFDAVLLFGPMYHLYTPQEQHKALDEAIRLAKPGGLVIAAFLSVYAILYNNYLNGNFRAGLEENFDPTWRVRHFQEQMFTGFDIEEFEALFAQKPVNKLALAGTDSLLELAQKTCDFQMSNEEFELFFRHHLACCEKRELLGNQSHLLYICRKNLS